ncbi:DNA polymerase III subunit chi [Teredinibacter purpureus]|uniref:DNA polymerase III subunit chi n=1 Tax=Teredinibacter purpureus TaxID=2731756 RepID=UPI0005F7C661|nr:DNA polymerase III subunit chi [Teredinibacter purpureus]
MTRIDFYILKQLLVSDRHMFACRLIDKAVTKGNRVMVATNSEEETRTLDAMLWNFRPESFIPHYILGEEYAEQSPVVISHAGDTPNHHDLLVNLREAIPPEFSRYQRLAEIVVQETAILTVTRQHYGFYKARGYQLNSHTL